MQRGEKPRAHLPLIHLIVDSVVRLSHKADPVRVAVAAHWQQAGNRSRFHAGQAFCPIQQRPPKRNHLRILAERGLRQPYIHRRQMIRLKSKIEMQQLVQALSQQSRPRQQHHRRSQFNHHQVRAHPPPQRPRRRTSALRQPIPHIRESEMQNRRGRKQHRRKQRQAARKLEYMCVQPQSAKKRHADHHVFREQPHQNPHSAIRQSKPRHAAGRNQRQPFRHKLPAQPRPRCPQRAPHRNLAPSALRPHQQQARHIHARNEQQQPRPSQQHQQNRPDIPHDDFR